MQLVVPLNQNQELGVGVATGTYRQSRLFPSRKIWRGAGHCSGRIPQVFSETMYGTTYIQCRIFVQYMPYRTDTGLP
jgi:hypothetical protein